PGLPRCTLFPYPTLFRSLVEYIEEEYGHHEWILNDIEACGGDRQQVKHGKPCLAIELMVAFLYDQIQRGNPVAFFGMVMVLEGRSEEHTSELQSRENLVC